MPNTSKKSVLPLIARDRRAILLWLCLCAFLVACMVLVGGYTRLSGSGLSITSWKPIHGSIPPLDHEQWEEEFAAYKQSPQFQKVNSDMVLEDFKTIFWPEFWHRVLGRMIGLVFFFPLLLFMVRKSISRRLGWRLAGIFALGGLQGVIGWLMVASGLVDMPRVSHLRLALHLSVAFAIFACILWTILDIAGNREDGETVPLPCLKWYRLWYAMLCIQIVLGAFMAGLHAGLVYNTWPSMNGQLVPDGLWSMSPWYLNLFENHALVQFAHRKLAVLLALGFALWWYCSRKYVRDARLGNVCLAIAAVVATQFVLGVLTLLQMVPLPLALAHQMTGLLLFAAGLVLMHALCQYRKE